ncbi:amidohydrolase [Isoptericola croceus]|uniref:amidohydrolase n=1 Tax=Isoptericola croceus TaxID=3031406 RepID=UPI0023F9347C|nr:amidohydrolase [Isoptericola croceus]
MSAGVPGGATERLDALVAELEPELVAVRRDLHAHPEVAWQEFRTTAVLVERLRAAGLSPRALDGTGLVCDVGPDVPGRGRVALRADIDALPLDDLCGCDFASTVPGVAHACGHDLHAAVVLGAGLALARIDDEGLLDVGARLIFQPAEESMPGGAHAVISQGVLDGVERIAAMHAEPKLDVGLVGTRIGPITSASDLVTVTLSSGGGHTSRPHLTGDVVYALGQVITQVPAVLGRRLDPRSGVNLTWGAVEAGNAHNAIPTSGVAKGTLRCLDVRAWEKAGQVLIDAVEQVVAPYDVDVSVHHVRGVPPVDNDAEVTAALEEAGAAVLGEGGVVLTEQSLGGEDFAWYLTKVPGAMARLGTATPGERRYDIHRGDLVVDERAIGIGARLLARFVLGPATSGDVPLR